jgi:hypothetical protein
LHPRTEKFLDEQNSQDGDPKKLLSLEEIRTAIFPHTGLDNPGVVHGLLLFIGDLIYSQFGRGKPNKFRYPGFLVEPSDDEDNAKKGDARRPLSMEEIRAAIFPHTGLKHPEQVHGLLLVLGDLILSQFGPGTPNAFRYPGFYTEELCDEDEMAADSHDVEQTEDAGASQNAKGKEKPKPLARDQVIQKLVGDGLSSNDVHGFLIRLKTLLNEETKRCGVFNFPNGASYWKGKKNRKPDEKPLTPDEVIDRLLVKGWSKDGVASFLNRVTDLMTEEEERCGKFFHIFG